jgi:APA family basic amino acid/polyamine antiporter
LYLVGAAVVLVVLFCYRTSTTWPGLIIILSGIPVYALLQRNAHRRSIDEVAAG